MLQKEQHMRLLCYVDYSVEKRGKQCIATVQLYFETIWSH